jgi:TonB family protein
VPGALPVSGESEISRRAGPALAPRRALVALSEDAQLLEALAGVPATVGELVLCSAVDRFAEQLVAEACGVALIDASGIVDPIDFIASLRRQFPELVLVVAGGGHLQGPLTTLLADGTVFRFIHKPASAQRLQLFLEAAVRRYDELTELPSSKGPSGAQAAPGRPGQRRGWWLAAAAVGTAGATTLLALMLHKPHAAAGAAVAKPTLAARPVAPAAPPAAPQAALLTPQSAPVPVATQTTPPATAPAAAASDVSVPTDPMLLQLLASADRALARNQLDTAEGTGAGDLYRAALQRAPGNARALRGLDSVTTLLLGGAERYVATDHNDDATRLVADVLRLQPDNVRAATLSVQLSQQREAELREQLQRTAKGARTDQALVYLQLARRRMDSGALFEPIDDSASSYLEAARTMAPDDPGVRALTVELNRRLAAVRQSRTVRETPTGSATAQAAPVPAAVSTRIPAPIAPAPIGASSTATAGSAAPAPLATADPGASSSGGTDGSVAASSLERDRFVPPEYPRTALARGLTGWVDMEFTVTAAGAVTDIAITGAQPHDVFDEAALAAISQWHFRPVLRGGMPVEQRAHVRMRFSL